MKHPRHARKLSSHKPNHELNSRFQSSGKGEEMEPSPAIVSSIHTSSILLAGDPLRRRDEVDVSHGTDYTDKRFTAVGWLVEPQRRC